MFLFHFACCVTTVSDSLQHKMVGKECEGEELIHNRVRVRAKYTPYNLRGLREISSCADVVSLKNGPYKIMLPSSLFAFINKQHGATLKLWTLSHWNQLLCLTLASCIFLFVFVFKFVFVFVFANNSARWLVFWRGLNTGTRPSTHYEAFKEYDEEEWH